MKIERRIQELFDPTKSHAKFHDQDGNRIDSDYVQRIYKNSKAYLQSHCKEGDVVGIRLSFGAEYLILIYACMELGVTYLPLRDSWPDERVEQIRGLSKFTMLIDPSNIQEIFSYESKGTVDHFSLADEKALYVIYTSGSTGAPKGVTISRNSYSTFVDWLDRNFSKMNSETRLLFVANFTFDMSLLDVGLFLVKRCHAFFTQFSEGNVFRFAYEIETFKINSIATVPTNMQLILQDGVYSRSDFTSLKFLLLGGSRFSLGVYHSIFEKMNDGIEVYNFYGPTEATVYTHVKKLENSVEMDLHESNVSIGKPFSTNQCSIVDRAGKKITSANEVGEIWLHGDQIMLGYYKDEEKTRQNMITDNNLRTYKTGDLGFFNNKGDYFITGRLDETIKRRGYRVNLLDIDSYIQNLEEVSDCMTLAFPDEMTDNILLTCIVPSNGQQDRKQLKEKMREFLLDYQVPDQIEFIEKFPLNNSGKVCRKTLEATFRPS